MKRTIRYLFVLFLFCVFFESTAQKKIPVYKYDQLAARIENNSDTLYIVNFWATWCKPCVAELPDFEKVNNDFGNQKVKVLLMSMDFKEDIKKRVIPFLKKNKYKSEVIILDETDGTFIDKVSKEWSGAIPATLFIKNNKKDFIGKKVSYEILTQKINELNQ